MFSNINHDFIGLERAEQRAIRLSNTVIFYVIEENLHSLVKNRNPEEIGACCYWAGYYITVGL